MAVSGQLCGLYFNLYGISVNSAGLSSPQLLRTEDCLDELRTIAILRTSSLPGYRTACFDVHNLLEGVLSS